MAVSAREDGAAQGELLGVLRGEEVWTRVWELWGGVVRQYHGTKPGHLERRSAAPLAHTAPPDPVPAPPNPCLCPHSTPPFSSLPQVLLLLESSTVHNADAFVWLRPYRILLPHTLPRPPHLTSLLSPNPCLCPHPTAPSSSLFQVLLLLESSTVHNIDAFVWLRTAHMLFPTSSPPPIIQVLLLLESSTAHNADAFVRLRPSRMLLHSSGRVHLMPAATSAGAAAAAGNGISVESSAAAAAAASAAAGAGTFTLPEVGCL